MDEECALSHTNSERETKNSGKGDICLSDPGECDHLGRESGGKLDVLDRRLVSRKRQTHFSLWFQGGEAEGDGDGQTQQH